MPGRASVGPGTASEEPESVPGGIQWGLKVFGGRVTILYEAAD